jgi:NADPH:quinone reductase-like Zn-dependent oxidoreductase
VGSQSPDTAKTVRFHRTGPAEVLEFEDLPIPEPGPGEVRIRVKAIGLNRAEILFRQGQYMEVPDLPATNGYEASGIVDAVGPDVDPSWIGKTVSTIPGAFSLNQYGAYSEVAVFPEHAIAEYPGSLSYQEGASIYMQYLTAYGALVSQGKIAGDDFVLITAASSSVGVAAIEIVRAEGAKSIAVTRTAAKKAELREAGANHVIVTDDEDVAERVKVITSGKGARVVFDAVGGSLLNSIVAATSQNGIIFSYGAMSPDPAVIPLFPMMIKSITFKGFSAPELITHAEEFARAKKYIYEHLADATLKPVIAKTFSFSEIVAAHQYMESNAHVGKIVVTVAA